MTFLYDVFDASFCSTFSIFLSPKSLPKSSAKMVGGIKHSSRLCLSTVFFIVIVWLAFLQVGLDSHHVVNFIWPKKLMESRFVSKIINIFVL